MYMALSSTLFCTYTCIGYTQCVSLYVFRSAINSAIPSAINSVVYFVSSNGFHSAINSAIISAINSAIPSAIHSETVQMFRIVVNM